MKVLVLYEYPPTPGGLATQGDLLYKGLMELGVDVHAAHFESDQEKEWYYRWFKPDVVMVLLRTVGKPKRLPCQKHSGSLKMHTVHRRR